MSRRGRHPSHVNQIWERRAQLRQAGMDTQCLEFPLNGRMSIVCQCVLQTSSPKCSDCQTACSLGRVQTTTTPLYHLKVSCFACVAIWFRRLKFTHATVLTLTIRNCCRKFRVGACSHSVRKVCVCRSMHAKCGCQGSVLCFGNLFLTYGYMVFRVLRDKFGSCILCSMCVCGCLKGV